MPRRERNKSDNDNSEAGTGTDKNGDYQAFGQANHKRWQEYTEQPKSLPKRPCQFWRNSWMRRYGGWIGH